MDLQNSAHDPLKILMASGVPKRREGGVAAMIYNLGGEMERRGHQVTYLFREDLVKPGSVTQRFEELLFSLRLARFIVRRPQDFSVVNLHAPVGFPYGWRRRWSRSRRYPPYVMTLHGLEERRVHVMSREAKKGQAWHFSWKNRLWHRFYHQPRFRWCIKTANGAHAGSRDVWNLLQLKYNLDSDRVAYIPTGVEPRFFIPREVRSRDGLKLLYAGTWLDQRGLYYIRSALLHLAPRIPGLTLTIAGGGVPEAEITGFFGPQLSQQIRVRPVVPADAMPHLYAEHDVFLFPSLMEGFPTVVLEAMATGMPVITTETCGMPDVVEHGVNGLLIPPANSRAIEEAVLYLANSPDARRTLGVAARETAKRYTWERSARLFEDLCRRIIEKEEHAHQ